MFERAKNTFFSARMLELDSLAFLEKLSNIQRETMCYYEQQYYKNISYITITNNNVLFTIPNFTFTIPHNFL